MIMVFKSNNFITFIYLFIYIYSNIIGANGTLKANYGTCMTDILTKNSLKSLDQSSYKAAIVKAWDKTRLDHTSIKREFSKTGIWPHNRNAVNCDKFDVYKSVANPNKKKLILTLSSA